jgi:molybdenum ABC transporter molybdate-binding protein
MPADDHATGKDWTVGFRIWVERSGRTVLGNGRLQLLEAIDRCRSISAAARQLRMSYRRAWLLVQSVNEAAGQPLVVAATGGSGGGGAQLTPQGHQAVAIFRQLQQHLRQNAEAILPRLAASSLSACVHVAAAVSLEEALGQLLADFAVQQPAMRVRAIFGASNELADHLLAGGAADLFLTADPEPLDRLETAGLVEPGTRRVLVTNTLAAVAPTNAAATIHKPGDLAQSQVQRIALAEPASPLGHYTRAFLESVALYETLLPRAVHVDNSRGVVAAVRAGLANVGLVYGSDAGPTCGCRLLFHVRRPPVPIEYTAALVRRGQQPDQARRLLDFLTSAQAAGRFRHCGFLSANG